MLNRAHILRCSRGTFSLNIFMDSDTFNRTANVWLPFPWFLWVKLSRIKKKIQLLLYARKRKTNEQMTESHISQIWLLVFVCFCFPELLNWLFYISTDNIPAVWQRSLACPFLCDTREGLSPIIIKHCRISFLATNASITWNFRGGFFFCVCVRALACVWSRGSSQKVMTCSVPPCAWLIPLFSSKRQKCR